MLTPDRKHTVDMSLGICQVFWMVCMLEDSRWLEWRQRTAVDCDSIRRDDTGIKVERAG